MFLLTWLNLLWQSERKQWLSANQLAELRRTRLQKLIMHSYNRVPFYRNIFDQHGLNPKDVLDIEDLHKVPILTKQVLQQGNSTDFLAQGIDPSQCDITRTSGSTGKPIEILRLRNENLWGWYMTMVRAQIANGVRPWHRQAFIEDRARMPKKNWSISRLKPQEVYLLAGQQVQEQLNILQSVRPHFIRGYSNSLSLLAHSMKQSNIKDISPKIVMGYAELLDKASRSLINEVFNVEMVDLYATAETYGIAWECPKHSGYHINADSLIVEFIRDGRPAKVGEQGHIVVTSLYQYAMPLIRYDLEDIGIPTNEKCSCGRDLPLMAMIQGRVDDFVTLRNGTIIPPIGTFADVINGEQDVREFLVVQEDYDLIVVKLVVNAENDLDLIGRVRHGIEDLIQHEAVVKVEIVKQIDRGNDVKLRRIISKVRSSL